VNKLYNLLLCLGLGMGLTTMGETPNITNLEREAFDCINNRPYAQLEEEKNIVPLTHFSMQ
jgi:hypothetical protein